MGRLSLVYTSRRRMESSHSRAAWLNSTYTHTHREKDGRETTTMTTAPSCVYSFPAFCFFFLLLFSHLFIAESCRRGNKKKEKFEFFLLCVWRVPSIYIFSLSSGRHVATFWGAAGPVVLSSCELWVELGGLGCWVFPSFVSFFFFFCISRGFSEGVDGKKRERWPGGWMDGWMDEGKVEDPPRRGFG